MIHDECVPLLQITSNLGYILSLGLKSQIKNTVNDADMFFNFVDIDFQIYLKQYLQVSSLTCESSYLYSNLSCKESESWINGTDFEVYIYVKIFIEEIVNRTFIENKLVSLSNQMFNYSYESSVYDFSIYTDANTFHLPEFIHKIEFTDWCFIRDTNHMIHLQRYVHSHVSELLTCKQIELIENEFIIDFKSLKLTITSNNMEIENDQYILKGFRRARICVEKFEMILQSTGDGTNENNNIWGIAIMICTIISLVCLVLTFITYCLFPSLRSLPGKNNMCLVFSMFFAHSLFQFGVSETGSEIGCKIIGILTHYFWLATFGCLSICSFHMFRVFRSKTLLNISKSKNNKLLLKYVLYSFGAPLIIVSTNATVTVITKNSFGYGGSICFMNELIAVIVTFLSPITLVCVINIFFFVVTSLKIASTPKIENESQQSTSNRVHFVVYVKLFTITGITWIFQIIDSFLPMSALSTIVSILNALQGVFIFVSYICNKRVLRLYKDSRRLRHGYKLTKTSRSKTITTSLNSSSL